MPAHPPTFIKQLERAMVDILNSPDATIQQKIEAADKLLRAKGAKPERKRYTRRKPKPETTSILGSR